MSCREEWSAVTSLLYSGISSKLSFYKDFPKLATPKKLKELEDAIKVYLKNCITSRQFLLEEYQALCGRLGVHIDECKNETTRENVLSTIEDYRKQERYDPQQLRQIKIGLKKGIDVSKYADPSYNAEQMLEILWGLEDGVDVNVYADPELSPREMERRRLNLICSSKTGSTEAGKEVDDQYEVEI